MVNLLYAVSALTCALVLIMLILPLETRYNLRTGNKHDRAFSFLITWTASFCVVDCIWGVLASDVIMNDTMLYIFSIAFHSCAAFTPLVWLMYVFSYLGNVKGEKLYLILFSIIFCIQIIMLIANIVTHKIFYIDDDGIYCVTPTRKLLFYMQYITYIFIAVISVIKYVQFSKDESASKPSDVFSKKRSLCVILFVLAPILTGVFQMIYPDAPAYSIGYTLGCCIIYSFVLTDMLHERMVEQAVAQASNQAKTEFLFNMSHDIRTPMNAILGYADIGLAHVEDVERSRDSYNKIKSAGDHLLSLINDILEMSRIESGKLELTVAPLDIRDTISYVSEMGQALALPKSISFESSVRDIENPYVYADELHIEEVLINLLSNAIKYTNEGGKVKFGTYQESGIVEDKATLVFQVSDNGIGMSDEFQGHLFESFSREETEAVSKIEGTGLGLSIVKHIVDISGGDISVESKTGVGTTFTVRIPLKVMNSDDIDRFNEKNQNGGKLTDNPEIAGKKVLLVEDNEMNRDISTEILEEASIIVETAVDGALAVDSVIKNGTGYYDFILMDIQMPVMNGYEATKAIRALPGGDTIPIIALSANAFAEDKKNSLAAGMNSHVAKPINTEELFKEMLALL